jgi:hypothetical protein
VKRTVFGLAAVVCYAVLYWGAIIAWSLAESATFGGIPHRVDVPLRAVLIPFVLGGILALAFGRRLEMWALCFAPFAALAGLLVVTGMNWHEVQGGVLGFFVVGTVAGCAAVAGALVERRLHASSW